MFVTKFKKYFGRSTQKRPVLHPDLSGQQEPVLLMGMSTVAHSYRPSSATELSG